MNRRNQFTGGVTNNCNQCTENQLEIKFLLKQIEGLQLRILELKEVMSCCSHNQVGTIAVAASSALAPLTDPSIIKPPPIRIKNEMEKSLQNELLHEEEISADCENMDEAEADMKFIRQDIDDDDDDDAHDPASTIAIASSSSSSSSSSSASGNTRRIYTTTSNSTFKCPLKFNCSSSFIHMIEMKRHVAEAHNWPKNLHFCSVCGVVCLSKSEEKEHVRLYHGLNCILCSSRFNTYEQYLEHMRAYHQIGSNMFTCSECVQEFHSKRVLIQHMLSVHCVGGENTSSSSSGTSKEGKQLIWLCEHCGVHLLSRKEKEDHLLKRQAQACSRCNASFSNFQSIRKHSLAKHEVDVLCPEEIETIIQHNISSDQYNQQQGTTKRVKLE